MGILYNIEEEEDLPESSMKANAPPEFYIRPARPKRRSRASNNQFQLPAYLASSLLRDSPEIAPWFAYQATKPAPSFFTRTTIQHRHFPSTPQSLPATVTNSFHDLSRLASPVLCSPSPILFPLACDDEDLADATWDFITSNAPYSAPPSEPETWILLSDDL
jgi:hypothetical protein